MSETRADCFYTLFRELFLTLSHRCPTIVKILPAQLRLLKENVGGLALCGDAWKNDHVFLFISVMFSFKIVNTACHRYERLTLHPTPPQPRQQTIRMNTYLLFSFYIKNKMSVKQLVEVGGLMSTGRMLYEMRSS